MTQGLKFLIILTIVLVLILFGINLSPWQSLPSKYVNSQDIVRIDVKYKGVDYPLNYAQRQRVLQFIDQVVPTPFETYLSSKDSKVEWEALILYLSETHHITLKPIAKTRQKLLISAPEWEKDGLLMGQDSLSDFLKQAYDRQ